MAGNGFPALSLLRWANSQPNPCPGGPFRGDFPFRKNDPIPKQKVGVRRKTLFGMVWLVGCLFLKKGGPIPKTVLEKTENCRGRFWASLGPGVAGNGFPDPSSFRWADSQPNPCPGGPFRGHFPFSQNLRRRLQFELENYYSEIGTVREVNE